MSKIIVVGSSNIDMTARVSSLPRPGETIGGGTFMQANGGKGANQAVAASRLGGDVAFLTCVGNDISGRMLKEVFSKDGINTDHMKFADGVPTGTALIFVDAEGENCIAVAPGANNELKCSDIDGIADCIRDAEYMLLQMEIPSETVWYAIDKAYSLGTKVILNPAPMCCEIPEEVFRQLYLITPNETETGKILGVELSTEEDIASAAESLMAKGVANAIITLGSAGSYVCSEGFKGIVPARKVVPVDTTAAGDVYNGALVTALSEGSSLVDAVRFATAASSISVTRPGAQPSAPWRSEVNEIINI